MKIGVNEYGIESKYKFIVVATDGVWELMSNEEVVNIVFKYYDKSDVQGAVDAIINEAYSRWVKADLSVDDISCVIVFLQ